VRWSRRRFLVLSSAAAGAASVLPHRLLAQVPETSLVPVRGGVHAFSGRGGTIGLLLRDDAVVVVDAQFPVTAEVCLGHVPDRRIDVLINTHHHQDHTNGTSRTPTCRRISVGRRPSATS